MTINILHTHTQTDMSKEFNIFGDEVFLLNNEGNFVKDPSSPNRYISLSTIIKISNILRYKGKYCSIEVNYLSSAFAINKYVLIQVRDGTRTDASSATIV